MTCSNKWAKPVLPGTSFLEPTAYQMQTATTGARWSSATISRNPFESRSSLKLTVGAVIRSSSSRVGGRRSGTAAPR